MDSGEGHLLRGDPESVFKLGDQVEHPRFGLGKIQRLMSRPRGLTATIDFNEYGPRTLLVAHAGLQRLGGDLEDSPC